MRASLSGFLLLGALCTAARATELELPADGSSVVGADEEQQTRFEDTLVDIAHDRSIGYEEIARANPGVDLWLPGEGTSITVPGRHILPPGPREGIVINLPEHRLYYYPPAQEGQTLTVFTFPVNIGRLDRGSPIGLTHVTAKQKNPSWYPPAFIRKEHQERGDPLPAVVPPGPKNPLGKLEMRLAAARGTYLIHGTNTPWAIGMAITHGCISMYPEDVAVLYREVPVGTSVWMINAPVKVARLNGELLIEAHPPLPREGTPAESESDLDLLVEDLGHILGAEAGSIEQDRAIGVLREARGIPSPVPITDTLRDASRSPAPSELDPSDPPSTTTTASPEPIPPER
jgi:L,D-transpeptidase ErfK/SrfK